MKSTPKSQSEKEMEKILGRCITITKYTSMKIEHAEEIITAGYKLLAKCEELRKSKDTWRTNCEVAREEIKMLKKKLEEMGK